MLLALIGLILISGSMQAEPVLAAAPRVWTFTLISGAEVGPGGQAYFTAGHGHHGLFGRGGEIDGQPNPTLRIKQGDTVKITLLDLDQRGQPAQLSVPAFHVQTPVLTHRGDRATLIFTADRAGTFEYDGKVVFDGRPQHVHAIGTLLVEP